MTNATHTVTRRAGEADYNLIERAADAAGLSGLVGEFLATCANCSIFGGVNVTGDTVPYSTTGYDKVGVLEQDGRTLTGCNNCDE